MGSLKDELFDRQNEDFDRKLSQYLGISYEDFSVLDTSLDDEASEDGFVYNYILKIGSEAPKHIIEKIQGAQSTLDGGYEIWIPAHDYENL